MKLLDQLDEQAQNIAKLSRALRDSIRTARKELTDEEITELRHLLDSSMGEAVAATTAMDALLVAEKVVRDDAEQKRREAEEAETLAARQAEFEASDAEDAAALEAENAKAAAKKR